MDCKYLSYDILRSVNASRNQTPLYNQDPLTTDSNMEFFNDNTDTEDKYATSEPELNCYAISSFTAIYHRARFYKNEKWIALFNEFWKTIEVAELDAMNNFWESLGDLIEANLSEKWKADDCEADILYNYVFNHTIPISYMKHSSKFDKYREYFQEMRDTGYYEFAEDEYDSDYIRDCHNEDRLDRVMDRYER